MNPRTAVAPIAVAAVLLMAAAGGSSPAAQPGPEPGSLDLLASSHPTSAEPVMTDSVFDSVVARGPALDADSAALTSTTCNSCSGESTSLHVIYARRAREARLDNVATAWAQECQGCTSTALSVQVVVLRGGPLTVPNNRALSLTAACSACRTSALAFQVVLVADKATPLSDQAMAELRAWFDEQVAALRASVAPPPPEPIQSPEPSPSPTPTDGTTPSPTPTDTASEPQLSGRVKARRARREAASALGVLQQLLASDLGAESVSSDVKVSR